MNQKKKWDSLDVSMKAEKDGTYDIGASDFKFKKGYFDSSSVDMLYSYTASGVHSASINLSASLIPYVDDVFDLGSPSKQFQNL